MSFHFARLARQVGAAGLVALLAACGGGGGGGGNSISISPKTLAFTGTQDSPAQPRAVEVSYKGDGVLVGYAPGVTPADWLGVEQGATSPGHVQFWFGVSPYLSPGTYQTSVRFVTGDYDGSDIKYRDMRVTYRVSDFAVTPAELSFEAIDGSDAEPTPATRSFTITASTANWTATSSQPWLVLGQTSGAGSHVVDFTLDAGALAIGTHDATVTVRDTLTNDMAVLTVALQKHAPRLTVAPTPLEFTLDAGSDESALTATLHVTDELAGADASRAVSWTLDAPTEAWLSVDATSGSSVPGTDVHVALVPEQLGALANGTHQASLTFHYTNAQVTSAPLTVPVSLDLSVPRAQVVMPATAVAGRIAPVVLHGYDLGDVQASQVTFDGVAAQSVTVLSNTEIRVLPPAGLAAGTRDIAIGLAQLDFSTASLEVVAPRDRPYATFATTGRPVRVLFDDARETLWVANAADGKVERYRFDGTTWSALAPFPIGELVDIARHPDGKTLLVVALNGIYTIDLDDAAATPVQRVSGYGQYSFFRAAATIDGRLILSSDPPCCTGVFPHFSVNLATWAVTAFPYPTGDANAKASGSLDGTRVHLRGDYHGYRYRSEQGVLEDVGGPLATSANLDGSRLASFTSVFDSAFTLVGRMSANSLYTAFGPTSQRIYGYRKSTSDTTAGRNVIIDDMTGTAGGGTFTEVARVALADEPGWDSLWVSYDFAYAPAPLAVSADERTVFVRGKDKLVIVPVPAP